MITYLTQRYSSARIKRLLLILALLGSASVVINLALIRWRRSFKSAQPTTAQVAQGLPQATEQSAVSPAIRAQIEQQEQWIGQHPNDVQGHLALARLYFVAEQFSEAIKHLLILKSQGPRNAKIYLRLAMAYKSNDQLEEALRAVRQALKLSPQDLDAREWLGEIYLAQGRSDDALATFNQCLKQNPKSYGAWMGKARSLEQLYVARRAISAIQVVTPVQKAVELEPNNQYALSVLARMTFAYLAQLDKAEKLARRAIQLDPDLAAPYLILVEIFLNKPTPARLDEALKLARKAAQLDSSQPEPLYLLARVQMRKNQVREAITSLERSMQIKPMLEAIYMLSLAYARIGEVENARSYSTIYKRWNIFMERRKTLLGALQHSPRNMNIYCGLAELYLSTGDYEPAENWLRKAQHIQKNHPKVLALLTMAELQKQQARQRGGPRPNLPIGVE